MTIQELLQNLGVEFVESGNKHCRPGWIQLRNCPFCGSSSYHLGYRFSPGYFNCWKCGGHHVIPTLQKLGVSHRDAQEFFHDKTGTLQPPQIEKVRTGYREPKGVGELHPIHRAYLRGRGFNPYHIEKVWGIRGIGIAHALSWRVFIPARHREVKVSWTSRSVGATPTLRYISAKPTEETICLKHLVYGLDFCRHSIVIVEGPFDAWRIGPGAGALFGMNYSANQIQKLIQIPHRFVCFDSAPEAQRKARELAEQLSAFEGTTENILIDAKDPGEASPREINLIRKVARIV